MARIEQPVQRGLIQPGHFTRNVPHVPATFVSGLRDFGRAIVANFRDERRAKSQAALDVAFAFHIVSFHEDFGLWWQSAAATPLLD